MTSLREVIAEALNSAYDGKWGEDWARHDQHRYGYYALCYVCRGDVVKLADAVREALLATRWMRLLLIHEFERIAAQFPEDVYTREWRTPDGIAGAAIRDEMLRQVRMLKDAAAEEEASPSTSTTQ